MPNVKKNMPEVELATRHRWAEILRERIRDLSLKNKDAGKLLQATAPQVSDLMHGRDQFFSLPQLLVWADRLGIDFDFTASYRPINVEQKLAQTV
ncbi:XRE family transcriptional regulator [Nocardia sp. NPDC051570]|uniref:XRE family transcriptional regulator n=1 Tax=Nocardia sp. NPDC051570 TaxID=3364324 RepID=UPI0037B57C56